jgi:hypothetical protein
MQKPIFTLLFFFTMGLLSAQTTQDTTYRTIPANPESFTPENVVARMIDGLGFRFYWATEGLRPQDLAYRPSVGARTCEETVDHILGLSEIMLNALKNLPSTRSGEETSKLAYTVKRSKVLANLLEASNLLKKGGKKLNDSQIIFQNNQSKREFPFWNMINGPIADALWHVGQVVSFRRASGNPFNAKANVFLGRLLE